MIQSHFNGVVEIPATLDSANINQQYFRGIPFSVFSLWTNF